MNKLKISVRSPWDEFPEHIMVVKHDALGIVRPDTPSDLLNGEYVATYVLNSVSKVKMTVELEKV